MTVPLQGSASTALAGIRVLDLTDELGAYAGRLLADLGAEVIRIEPPQGSPTRRTAPIVALPGYAPVSAFDRFVNAGKRSVTLDLCRPEAGPVLGKLLASTDLVIQSPVHVLSSVGFGTEELRQLNPGLSQIVVSPFGLTNEPGWQPADDLVVMAAGGLLHLGGYPDVGPVAAYGGQSRFAASIFAAVAAITALLQRDLTGEGVMLDVSAQECVAQALEDSAATYALTGKVRERQGDVPREAGTGVYPCADGYVSMVAGRLGTAKAWTALVAWMNETGTPGAQRLLAPDWQRFDFRQTPQAIAEFTRLFGLFAGKRTKEELYTQAQARMIALSPVSTVEDLFTNAQLQHRGFFTWVQDDELHRPICYPRAPYSLSATPPLAPRSSPRLGADNVPVLLDEVGVTPEDYRALVERGVA
jgi:benzylsuccinate CoA-transferase BbsE subunit